MLPSIESNVRTKAVEYVYTLEDDVVAAKIELISTSQDVQIDTGQHIVGKEAFALYI
jgi:uncharacterized protein YqfB (UPF0267 family)